MKNITKIIDNTACLQVLGSIILNPLLLEKEDKYILAPDDFPHELHKIIFTSVYNIFTLGASEITPSIISDYLEGFPKKKATYDSMDGTKLVLELMEKTEVAAFDYYYNRLKKFSLLRGYGDYAGVNISFIYDVDNIFDIKKKEKQENWLDNASIEDIIKKIDDKIDRVREKHSKNIKSSSQHIATGVTEMLKNLKENPNFGVPIYGKYMNTITRGARLGKFFLRSSATNVGKTRALVQDCCYIACDEMWSIEKKEWIKIDNAEPSLFIATEQDLSEIQLSCLAFLSGVNEEHIEINEYADGEEERVDKAIKILERSGIIFVPMPDFSLGEVESVIKREIREKGIKYIFLDYIKSSLSILAEIGKQTGGVKLREDNILFMMANRLKEICNKYEVFIFSSTQLNSGYQDADIYDQNLLRGAKAIADIIDYGSIMLDVEEKDREALAPLCTQLGIEMPNVKMSIYKNRANRWKNILVWISADRGICQFNPVFVTNYDYSIIQDMTDTKIKIQESKQEEKGAF